MLSELSVNGVRLGNTRTEVESLIGEPTQCNNPAWNRYGAGRELLVLYHPAWPQTSPESWQVRIVVGNQLEYGGEIILQVGSTLEEVLARLGRPLETGLREADTALWEYSEFYLTVDYCTQTVINVGLKRYLAPESGQPKSRWILTAAGAIAC